jgi:hypothetical protein
LGSDIVSGSIMGTSKNDPISHLEEVKSCQKNRVDAKS